MDLQRPPDFKEFLRLLDSERIEYLLVGGYAVSYHGYPRPTGDLDVWVAVHPETATKLVGVLGAFGFGGAGARPVAPSGRQSATFLRTVPADARGRGNPFLRHLHPRQCG